MPQALNTMGQVMMLKKDYEKAVQYFLKAIEQQPDVPARYWNVALALEQAGKYDMCDAVCAHVCGYGTGQRGPAAGQSGFIEHLKKMMGR